MSDNRDATDGTDVPWDHAVATSGWLEGVFGDEAVRGELGSVGAFTLVATAGSSASRGWVTIVDSKSNALYGTYRLDTVGVVTLAIVGGTGRFLGVGGSLIGSRDVTRPRWWLSGSLVGIATHPATTPPQPQ
ncbi:MAG: hypothetical protein QNJ75_01165 [Acidimicrobiia bacterium]|nr:hypothetical protein [Acidimicrobiia bacterium]